MAKKETSKSSESEEDISIDFRGLKNFFKFDVDLRKLLIVALILVPIILSITYRIDSAYLPVADGWGRNAVYQGVQSQIANQINQQYPNLPAVNKQELVNQQFNKFLKEQGPQLEQQVKATSNHFKSRLQNNDGQTYLLAIDPYQWFRITRNWLEKGQWYDDLKDGEPWNYHKIAPIGEGMGLALHVVFAVFIFKVVSFFNSGLPLMTVFFYLPVLFASLSVIPAFFLARRKGGDLAGFAAAIMVAVHTSFLGRTSAGFSDTDAYNVLFPLMITWLFVEAFESDNLKIKITLSALAGSLVGIFSFTWGGWWYIYDFLLIVLASYLIFIIIRSIVNKETKGILKDKSIRNTLLVGAVFILFSGIFITLFTSFGAFLRAPLQPLGFRIFKAAAHASLWPNVFTTVAELGDTSIITIVNAIGGKTLFFLSLLGLSLTMISKENMNKRDWIFVGFSALIFLLLVSDKGLGFSTFKFLIIMAIPLIVGLLLKLKDKRAFDVKYALFLTVWFAGTIYPSTKGVRFIMLLVPAFAVAFGIGIGIMHELISDWLSKEIKMKDQYVTVIVAVALLLLLVTPIKAAANSGAGGVPSMNDAWWDSLEGIKQNSQPDAIINSWWDFGHWFKSIADRSVTFDGASQNTPMAHWIGRTLLIDDEKTSVGILRMLDCGSNKAFESINKKFEDTVSSVHLIYEIILLDKEKARSRLLKEGFGEAEVSDILAKTHCEPPENFFITSEDMVGKAGVWAHFGNWNFERAYIYTNLKAADPQTAIDEMVSKFDYSEEEARKTYYDVTALQSEQAANAWISPWPNYVTGRWVGCSQDDEAITCNINAGIGNQGSNSIILEKAIFNKSDPDSSVVLIGARDRGSGVRVGSSEGKPEGFAIAGEDEITRYKMEEATFPYDILIDEVTNHALVLHPMFTKSLFTKLFYLEGRYTKHFEKFSDKQGVNGWRIIVWKVDWDGSEEE